MILDVMFPSGEYVLPCVTPSVVSRARAPNVARGKMQKKKKREKMFLVLIGVWCIMFPVRALKHHRGTTILV